MECLKGEDETIDVKCDVSNLSSVLLLARSFSSFLRNLFSLEYVLQIFRPTKNGKFERHLLGTVFPHTKHTQELPIKSCNLTFPE